MQTAIAWVKSQKKEIINKLLILGIGTLLGIVVNANMLMGSIPVYNKITDQNVKEISSLNSLANSTAIELTRVSGMLTILTKDVNKLAESVKEIQSVQKQSKHNKSISKKE